MSPQTFLIPRGSNKFKHYFFQRLANKYVTGVSYYTLFSLNQLGDINLNKRSGKNIVMITQMK